MERKRVSFDREKLSRQEPTIRPERSPVGQSCREVGDFISRNPTTAVLASFGIGLGLGFLLCQAVPATERRWLDRERASAIGHRVWESIARSLPESVASHVSS